MQTAKKMEQLQEVSNKMKKYLFIFCFSLQFIMIMMLVTDVMSNDETNLFD